MPPMIFERMRRAMYGYNSIKDARKAVGLKQREAAEILGISRRTIQSWESGLVVLSDVQRDIFIKVLIESKRKVNLLVNQDMICIEINNNGEYSKRVFTKPEYEYAENLMQYYYDNGYQANIHFKA